MIRFRRIQTMKIEQYISVDPNVCHGKPCFKGTRIMVYIVLELLEAGETPEQILKTYPTLTTRAIRAVYRYLIEDSTDARALKRAIRTSRGTISHRQLLQRLNKEDLEARSQKFLALLDASRKSGRVSAKAVKRKAGLASVASRAKGRAPSLQSLVREVHAYRHAKRRRVGKLESLKAFAKRHGLD